MSNTNHDKPGTRRKNLSPEIRCPRWWNNESLMNVHHYWQSQELSCRYSYACTNVNIHIKTSLVFDRNNISTIWIYNHIPTLSVHPNIQLWIEMGCMLDTTSSAHYGMLLVAIECHKETIYVWKKNLDEKTGQSSLTSVRFNRQHIQGKVTYMWTRRAHLWLRMQTMWCCPWYWKLWNSVEQSTIDATTHWKTNESKKTKLHYLTHL